MLQIRAQHASDVVPLSMLRCIRDSVRCRTGPIAWSARLLACTRCNFLTARQSRPQQACSCCLQIYRALKPAASNEACSAMLSCLFKCMSAPTQLALEVAVDIILTLQANPGPGAVSSSAQSSEMQS